MAKIKIKLDYLSKGKVIVDGKDISNSVRSLTLVSNAGEIPYCVIDLIGEIEFEGEVEIGRAFNG
jgi:hypothetical protein